MLSLDANILVYSTDIDSPEKQNAAIRILAAAVRVETGLTEQSIVEFIHVATRKVKMPLARVAHIVREWRSSFALLVPSANIIEDTLALLERYRLSVWDARLLAVCAGNGCDVLLSEDFQDHAVYEGVRIVNPFNPGNAAALAELLQT